MFRKLACAMFVMMAVSFGFVVADEFPAIITKVDGDKISFFKTKKGKKDGEEITIPAIEKVRVAKGKFDKAEKKWTEGDAIEGGVKAEIFTKIDDKGVVVRITTDDETKKIKQILLTGKVITK
jgi:hypothetical protein